MGDFQLWKSFTRDVDPLEEVDWAAQEEELRQKEEKKSPQQIETTPIFDRSLSSSQKPIDKNPQLDRRTEERLRKGNLPMEAQLDLHGYRQDAAKSALTNFIQRAQAQGKRCVLVITGKGSQGEPDEDWTKAPRGILRQRVPEWLSESPLSSIVLKTVSAQRKDGGEGAFYVYLRRNKDHSS